VSNFDLLHPALKHHIANSLGWRELRPFQEDVIPHLLAGKHAIIVAPTAGGKTEASLFPVLSRMLAEGWSGLSTLYICPIKALLNNLEIRLNRYYTLLGRHAALWHGDVKTGARQRILREPPDCLLTTPESLELMLVSRTVEADTFFHNVQVVIVDEVHAFAGDDRGWHLLSVLERIVRVAGREFQRIGLSATVSNPDELLTWLAGSCDGDRFVYHPETSWGGTAEIRLDYVGSLGNAATVISRLHRGEKRLIFVDSRARAELLGCQLRQLGVTTFVTHSSLSHHQRRDAEEAFASRDDCTIVATSVLELGVDVGDLDRVIQIDAPATVSSFVQRMGRTGRRSGTQQNCLFLATNEMPLLQAAALIELWSTGFVEPVKPPLRPLHIFAQQLMALALQEGGIGRDDWRRWIARVPAFAAIPEKEAVDIIDWMVHAELFFDENGILWFGREGESEFARRNYMELLSVFTSPPLFRILHGRQELGFVDEMSFMAKRGNDRVVLLGGRSWHVTHIDWPRRIAHVEAAEMQGRSCWRGEAQGLSFSMAQAIRRILVADDVPECWSRRARKAMADVREQFAWLQSESLPVVGGDEGSTTWWTFAGGKANATLAGALAEAGAERVTHDSLSIIIEGRHTPQQATELIRTARQQDPQSMNPIVDEQAIEGLKFTQCLPPDLAVGLLRDRLRDVDAINAVLHDLRATQTVSRMHRARDSN
jgi:ATP-dependent Lhr-like helicase